MSAWFTPTKVDEHVGGAIAFDFGDGTREDVSSGKVTQWEPPARFGYEEYEVLRVYLENFADKPAAAVHATASRPGNDSAVWSAITDALNLTGANVGERRETPSDTPRLAGVVARIHQDANSREMMLRLDEPAEGVAVIGSCRVGEDARGIASVFLYGADAAGTAAAEQPKWTRWLAELLQPLAGRG